MVCTKADWDVSQKIVPYKEPYDDVVEFNTNKGVKNILDWTAATREDVNGVDFIVDEYNKTVTVDGTCTAAAGGSSTFVIRTVTGTENVGNLFKDCVLMGVPENANGNVYMSIELRASPYTLYAMDSGYGMSINEIPTNVGILIFIRVPSGKTVNNLVIKPMICHRSVLDKSYQPSALSNVMITPELIKLVDEGPKNLIEQSSGSDTRWVNIDCDLEPGTYVVSFGSITTTHTADSIQVTFFDSNWYNCGVNDSVVQMNLIDKFCVIRTVKRAAHLRIYASPTSVLDKVVTFTNLMVCTKSAWDVSQKYVPYALPNTKITPELIELVDSGAKNIFNEPVLTTGSAGEINVTVNGDGTFTLNTSGATTANSGVRIGWFTGKQGVTYAVSNYSPLCQLRVRYGSDIILDTSGDTNTFVAPSNAKAELIWYVPSGTTLTNYVLKPMVCSKASWDVSQKFVPYAMNNTELTNSKETCVRSNITDNVANNAASGTLYGSLSLTGITDAWGALTTYIFNNNGTRRMQICMTPNSSKKRFYDDNGWGAWSDI